ncbi:hypothetical protein ACMZ49_09395 [Alcaligenes phenolicus]
MKIKDLLNKALELLTPCSAQEASTSLKATVQTATGKSLKVEDLDGYKNILNSIYQIEKNVYQRFSRKTFFKAIEEQVFSKKFENQEFSTEDAKSIIEKFTTAIPNNVNVIAPISGIRLDGVKKFNIGPFEIGSSDTLTTPISNDDCYYIKINITENYDNEASINLAQDAFNDFIRLMFFFAGRQDNSTFIKTGLPTYPSYNHQRMYVDTSSYQVEIEGSNFNGSSINNKIAEKIPVDNTFFSEHEKFSEIWNLYNQRINGEKLSDFKSRILNCALAIGEAIRSGGQNTKNSIIYTCISLEILLSYDEGSLFQKSIGDRLADTFTFIVAKDKETRIFTGTILKKVYGMRSALVHGGSKEISGEYMAIIELTRAAIGELLTNEKYRAIKKIDSLYAMVKDAQNSY